MVHSGMAQQKQRFCSAITTIALILENRIVKLTKVHITHFRSIQDSSEFDIADVTCLVGKNESGKTALLRALHKLNPVEESNSNKDFNVDNEFPRSNLIRYRKDIRQGNRAHADVVRATFQLDQHEIDAIQDTFGQECLQDEQPTLTLSKGYSNALVPKLNLNDDSILDHLIESADLPGTVCDSIEEKETFSEMLGVLRLMESPTSSSNKLLKQLEFIENDEELSFSGLVFKMLENRVPQFLYFDEYYQMTGQENLEQLSWRINNNELLDSDHPFLGFIQLSGLDLEDLSAENQTTTRVANFEAASNTLTNEILPYWSQNQHIRMKFEVLPASPQDPPGMQDGTNVWGFIENTIHQASTELSARSKGFVWFFSFVAWYSSLREENKNLILLLDEPGLSLHGKAQDDLLRYIEEQLKPQHQVIYTTHSPFMVDSNHLDRVRIVQDKSIDPSPDDRSSNQVGVNVTTDVLEAGNDSLFPLQGALGYEIYQNLFVGPNCLIVEGVSDLLYIRAMSEILQDLGKPGLDPRWTITPVGGATNVPTFVALIGAQTNLRVALLLDSLMKNQQKIDNLIARKLIRSKQIYTYDGFIPNTNYADVEDMFDTKFYLELVNREYNASIKPSDLPPSLPRISERIESYLEHNQLPNNARFNHYRPARYFNTNIDTLKSNITQTTMNQWQSAFDTLNQLLPTTSGQDDDQA